MRYTDGERPRTSKLSLINHVVGYTVYEAVVPIEQQQQDCRHYQHYAEQRITQLLPDTVPPDGGK